MSTLTSTSLALLLCVLPELSSAACALQTSCYDIGGTVKACKEMAQDRAELLRLELKERSVAHRMCDAASAEQPWSEPPASNFEAIVKRDIAYYEQVTYYFVQREAGLNCASLKRKPITASVIKTCCDTPPGSGVCAIRGALIKLTSVD